MKARAQIQLLCAAALFAVCAVMRTTLEADPVTHILVQLPCLALAGWLVGSSMREQILRVYSPADRGLAGLLVAIFAIAFWMLPRSIDAALESPVVELAKFFSIPLLIGMPLAICWERAHPIVRGFLKAQTLSMLGVMAFLYTHAPIRICNNYLTSDQERLGFGFLIAAFVLALIWVVPLFVGTGSNAVTPQPMRRGFSS